jgi:phosphoadenosine phosphosulfate reductase
MLDVDLLNKSMSGKIVEARMAHVFNSYQGVLITSSFGTTSAIMLHIVSRLKPDHPIYMIDTGYLFADTLSYMQKLRDLLSLNIVRLKPEPWKHAFTRKDQTWNKDPDYCCQINKVEPLGEVISNHQIWVSGLIGYQNKYRSGLDMVDKKDRIYKIYPLIDWTPNMVSDYFEMHGLPRHPMEKDGYQSIGCEQCTTPGEGRDGRWGATGKTECGLHT